MELREIVALFWIQVTCFTEKKKKDKKLQFKALR